MRLELWCVALYASVAAAALAAIPLSAAGWIAPDPLSAVPALLLGLPWSYLLVELTDGQSLVVNSGLLVVAMAINAALLFLLARALSRWRRG